MLNAFSIDVEDWYQSSHNLNAPISKQCLKNTQLVLDILDMYNIKGTFYVQGMVAEKFPQLLKNIDSKGHEIQSHGYSHKAVNKMTPKEFFKDLFKTSSIIENIIGKPVTGFRAPDFSIDHESFWAFEVMIEAGINQDSSIFPIKTNRYGVNNFKPGYSVIKTKSGKIEELTVSILNINGIKIPVGGGGYIRLFPGKIINYALRRLNRENKPFVLYCHPYEYNHLEWKEIKKYIPSFKKIHQGIGRNKYQRKIETLFKLRTFTNMQNVIKHIRKMR